MNSDVFEASGGGDPGLQHIIWLLGHPSTWITFFLWAFIGIAIFKIAKRLLRARKTVRLVLFIAIVGIAVMSYIWLSRLAFQSYVEGLEPEMLGLRFAKSAVILLSIMSAGWIISDWFKAKR